MKDKYIKIIVSGLSKTGKTTIAELIGDVLSNQGFDVTLETDSDGHRVSTDAVRVVLDSNIKVLIQERDAFAKPASDRRTKFQPNKKQDQPQPIFAGVDQTIACVDCNSEFVFTTGEQEFFKAHKLDKPPRRCKACLAVKRSRQNASARAI